MGSDTICDEAVDAVEQNFGEFEQQAVRARFYFMQRFGFLFLHFHSSFLLAALRMHFEVQLHLEACTNSLSRQSLGSTGASAHTKEKVDRERSKGARTLARARSDGSISEFADAIDEDAPTSEDTCHPLNVLAARHVSSALALLVGMLVDAACGFLSPLPPPTMLVEDRRRRERDST